MITKDDLKNEVDNLPDSLLEDVYVALKRIKLEQKTTEVMGWNKWKMNLDQFTPDFMAGERQQEYQIRESLD